jgi:hypothetical protein
MGRMTEMSASHIFAWIVAQGLYHDLVSAFVLVPVMRVAANRPIRKLQHIGRMVDDLVIKVESDIEDKESKS